jgi:hypothetical protein
VRCGGNTLGADKTYRPNKVVFKKYYKTPEEASKGYVEALEQNKLGKKYVKSV